MGRDPQRIEKLRSIAMARVPELAKCRRFADVSLDDPIRVRVFDKNEQRLAVANALRLNERLLECKTVAGRRKIELTVVELQAELASVTRRLKKRVLVERRQQIYVDGQRQLSDMPIAKFWARMEVHDLSNLTRFAIISKYAVGDGRNHGERRSHVHQAVAIEHGVQLRAEKSALEREQDSTARAQRIQERRQLRARFLGQAVDELGDNSSTAAGVQPSPVESVATEATQADPQPAA